MSRQLSDRERVLSLERQLEEAQEREQKREQEAQKKVQEAQKREQEAQKKVQEAQKREQEAQKREQEATQHTTLYEYLQYCHAYLSKPLSIQSDKSKSTKGTTTQTSRKFYPARLLRWDDFLGTQMDNFSKIDSVFHPLTRSAPRYFNGKSNLASVQHMACGKRLASEKDLEFHQQLAVQIPVVKIISTLAKISHPIIQTLNIGGGVEFENHPNTLSRDNEEVQEREQQSRLNKKPIGNPKVDQTCVHTIPGDASKDVDERQSRAFIIEYKAPHKVSVEGLRRALSKEDLCTEVIRRDKNSVDKNLRQEEIMNEVVAKVVSQIFDYLIETCVEYGYLTTGEAFVFFRIIENDPQTLRYHIVVPNEEVLDEFDESLFYTAVSQVACFCLMAFKSKTRSMDWHEDTTKQLKRWPDLYENIPYDTSDSEGDVPVSQSTQASLYAPSSSSTIKPRTYNTRSSRSTCKDSEMVREQEDDNDPPNGPPSAEPRGARMLGKINQSSTSTKNSWHDQAPPTTQNRSREYCTQACLLGIKRGWTLDKGCPNVTLHRTTKSGTRHPVDAENFARLVRDQLERNRERDCRPLGKQGARGALFKLTLVKYGYTFVAKGTITVFVLDLLHEGRVYQQLEKIQGEAVPVYLGNIDLIKSYDLAPGVWIVHMLLMSWAGEEADEADVSDLSREEQRTIREVHREGVSHGDVRGPNILWNGERRRAMLVDFERSKFLPTGKSKSKGRKRKRRT